MRRKRPTPAAPGAAPASGAKPAAPKKKHPIKKMIPKVRYRNTYTLPCPELARVGPAGRNGASVKFTVPTVFQVLLDKDPPVIARDPKPIAGLMEFQQKGLRGDVWKVFRFTVLDNSLAHPAVSRNASLSVGEAICHGTTQSVPSKVMSSQRLWVPFR